MSEYELYLTKYKERMVKILEESGQKVQSSQRDNIYSLKHMFEKNKMLKRYPVLDGVLKYVLDDYPKTEMKEEMMKENLEFAFKEA